MLPLRPRGGPLNPRQLATHVYLATAAEKNPGGKPCLVLGQKKGGTCWSVITPMWYSERQYHRTVTVGERTPPSLSRNYSKSFPRPSITFHNIINTSQFLFAFLLKVKKKNALGSFFYKKTNNYTIIQFKQGSPPPQEKIGLSQW